jgi:hypothetical protein
MIVDPAHYARLPRRERVLTLTAPAAIAELTPGPGVGPHHPVPVVELRSLAIYDSFCEAGAPSDRSSSLGWEEVAHVAAV